MIANPIAAFFKVVHHLLYLSSLPHAVIILTPHRTTTNKAINHMIPNTRLKIPPAASKRFTSSWSPVVQERLIHPSLVITSTLPNHWPVGLSTAKLGLIISPHHTQQIPISRFFMVFKFILLTQSYFTLYLQLQQLRYLIHRRSDSR